MSEAIVTFLKPYVGPLAQSLSWAHFSGVLTSFLVAFVSFALYRLYLHPLSHIPGPVLARVTALWLWREAYRGTEASTLQGLHKKYGKVVRIGPNEVDIDDGAAIHAIYVKNGGFEKNPCYKNLDIDETPTIFSDTSNEHRASRAKAVLGMFSQQAIRDRREVVIACLDRTASKLEREIKQAAGKPIDVLSIFRSMSADATTAYLFGKSFGALDGDDLIMTDFVNYFLESSRYFYLPNALFKAVEVMRSNYEANWGAERYRTWKALMKTDKFVAQVVEDTIKREENDDKSPEDEVTYQRRLLLAGIPRDEVIAQCKDAMAAGADTTAMNLATIAFKLVQNPNTYDRLRRECLDNPNADPQTLPYLSAVVKEGLRLSLTTPNRFPRIVGPDGLHVPGLPSIPPGASVASCVWCMHLNDAVFPDARAFEPERWLRPSEEMRRDWIPFGAGSRQCIARNLATAILHWAVHVLVRKDLLKGARTVREEIELVQWFAARVKPDGKIELTWNA